MIKKFILFLAIISVVILASPLFANPAMQNLIMETENPVSKKVITENEHPVNNTTTPVLTGIVSEVQELPQGMYGVWKVTGTLLETNSPETYLKNTNDTWVLRKDGSFVTLINPENGASATITVNEVHNDTATFTRKFVGFGQNEVERVTLTLDGDSFHGIDIIYMEKAFFGSIKSYTAKYKITGERTTYNSNMGNIIRKPRTYNLSTSPYIEE
jgi:hypothetical protein